MTITPDRIDDLDFPTSELESPNLLSEPDWDVPYNDGSLILEEPTDWYELAAVSDRLYSPLILATLGVPDLGDGEAFRSEHLAQFTEPAPWATASGEEIYADIIAARQAILDAPPNYVMAQRVIDEQRERYDDDDRRGRGPYQHYCWCSPGRGMFFERYISASLPIEWPEPVTFTRWEPEPEPVMSKELMVREDA